MHLRNFIRRQKWRLRPLKRIVLPVRAAKRSIVQRWREAPAIERSTREYRGASLVEAIPVYPAETVATAAQPVSPNETSAGDISEPALIYHLRNVDFWARYGGSVVTSDNKLLADLSPEVWGIANHPLFSQFVLPARRKLTGRTAIAVTPEAPGNYYHWLIDLLPRVALLQLASQQFDRLLLNGSGADYEKASLDALKVPSHKIQYVNSGERFQIEEAIIPSMDHFAKAIAPWKVERLRQLRESAPRGSSGRLYISRRRAGVRRIINESELEQILRAANFRMVELEQKSWPEQIGLFSAAEVILAPHGAALANIVFAEPGTLVAEIGTRPGYKDFYWQLAAAARLRYRFIEARPSRAAKAEFRAVENEDMMIDPAAIRDFIAAL
jgi:hypothetical protein